MKLISLRFASQAVLFTLISASASQGAESGASSFSKRDLLAKIDYCQTCHGAQGQGFHGASPIPRLAGQPTEYLENQLRAFNERRRQNDIMFNVSHVMSPAMLTALATHFQDLNPKPIGGAPRQFVATGKKIYEEGVPDSNVPPCASCHGPDAKGSGAFPRLAGQLHDYIFKKLKNWEKERGQDPKNPDASAIMQPIAHALSDAQIKAVAAYLNHLE
jgi:cytochrome c553